MLVTETHEGEVGVIAGLDQLILGERQGFPPAGGHLLSTLRTAVVGEEPP